MDSEYIDVSYSETVSNTYAVHIEAQKQNDLLASLSRCYRSHEKEMELSNILADAIRQFFVDQDDEILTDALRKYRAQRYPNES